MADVRMPDGTIIRNVPEGATRAQLAARYGKRQAAKAPGNGSFGHGLADSLTLGFLDEAGAVADTLGIGMSGEKRPNIFNGGGLRDSYRQNVQRNREILKQKQAEAPGEFLAGQIGGALLPLPGGKAAAGSAVVQRARAALTGAGKAKAAGRVAIAAAPDVARGAIYGAGSSQEGQRLRGAAKGAGAGAAGHGIGRSIGAGVTRVLKGKAVDPAVRELADAGVIMTPGQRAGPGSIRKNLEEGFLGSIPLVKTIPQAAKRRGIEQMNVAAVNKALEPIGIKLPTNVAPGRELIQKAGDAAYSAYDASTNSLSLQNDKGLRAATIGLIKGAGAKVGPNEKQLQAIIENTMMKLDRGGIRGNDVRSMLSQLRSDASGFASSASANERNVGSELWKLHDALDNALARQNTGRSVIGFRKAREAVANFKRIEAAAAKSADGVFSPTQLRQAVTKRGFGTTTGKVARGEARLQSFADAAKKVLPDNLPNSGSPERLLAAGSALGGGPSIAAFLDPTAGAITGAGLLPYAPGIDKILQNLAINRPDILIRLGTGVERATPALGTAGAMTALGINQQP